MCYRRPAGILVAGGSVLAGVWAAETHRVPLTTVLGAALAAEVLVGLIAVMAVILRIRAEHLPENIVEHGHRHPHEHPVWPHRGWEGSREHSKVA